MSDPLVRHLKRVREAHHMSQSQVEECMKLAHGSYRHIERGRRPLPDFRQGLVTWMREFQSCVEASDAEREQILLELSRSILEQLAGLMDDLRHGK